MPLTCPLCNTRKPRRACPALGRTICTVCCATKREIEISCPPTCAYLSSARTHPPAVVQRRHERDLQFYVPLVDGLSERQLVLLMVFHGVILKHALQTIPRVLDEDVASAAAAVAATLETAGRGIIYEHQAQSLPAQRLASALTEAIREAIPEQTASASRIEREAAVALRRIEEGARTAARALAGDPAPVYLGLLHRVMARAFEESAASEEHGKGESRLIVPG